MNAGLIVICGPTAAGKSGLAMQVAQRLGTVILSADSRACYQEFDIGTAKPSLADRQRVPHYLIDICHPQETLTLADYQEKAQGLITQLQAVPETQIPLLVGGTGLYIKAIIRGLGIPRVPPQAELRLQLQALGQQQCYAFLQQVDPAAADRVHFNDEVRTIRALEVYYTTGRSLSSQQTEQPPTYPILQIGIDCDPTALTTRIQHRTASMLEAGLVTEVETLCQRYGSDLPLLDTLGYREIKQYLAGACSLAEAEAQTVLHTRQFAKRQRTWFRADRQIHWFDATQPNLLDQVWPLIQEFQHQIGNQGRVAEKTLDSAT